MFIIYAPFRTPRLEYVLHYLFRHIMAVDYDLTNDRSAYMASEKYKISYANAPIASREVHIPMHSSLLDDADIDVFTPEVAHHESMPVLFPVQSNAKISFDIFAAVFYMLSRYEEYLPFIKDAHGRFKAEESLAYKHGFLNMPVVDLWCLHFKTIIEKQFNIKLNTDKSFRFIPTIDIDIAYAYKYKGLFRSVLGYLRALKSGQWEDIRNRLSVNYGKADDPYDSFDYILELHERYKLETIFFVLVGDYGPYDKNTPYKDSRYQQLIRHLSDYAEIGIHPSYAASTDATLLAREIDRLSHIIRKDVTKSRHHYLKTAFPFTYRYLIESGIKEDYTMGFASYPGFRAGTASPYTFFDLDANKPNPLLIHPIGIMDGTLKDYLNADTEEACNLISQQLAASRKVNGTFISLFHNESLGEHGRWKGWRKVYEDMIKRATL